MSVSASLLLTHSLTTNFLKNENWTEKEKEYLKLINERIGKEDMFLNEFVQVMNLNSFIEDIPETQ